MIRLGTVLFMALASLGTAIAEPIDVFLIAGQSNAEGAGEATKSPVPSIGTAYVWFRDTLEICKDPVGHAATGSAWPSFAIAYHAATGRKVLFAQRVWGGTSLYADPRTKGIDWSPTGTLVPAGVKNVKDAMAAARAAGYEPVWRGVLWAQGEEEAGALMTERKTEDEVTVTLKALIARFNDELGDVGFYIFRVGSSDLSDVGYAAMRRVQERVAVEMPNVHVVYRRAWEFSRLGWQPPRDVHYTQEGYNDMGAVGGRNVADLVLKAAKLSHRNAQGSAQIRLPF